LRYKNAREQRHGQEPYTYTLFTIECKRNDCQRISNLLV